MSWVATGKYAVTVDGFVNPIIVEAVNAKAARKAVQSRGFYVLTVERI
jgi:hypothetical protein